MGLLGLRKFIDSSGSTRLLPVPLSEEEAAQLRQQQQQQQQRQRQPPHAKRGSGGGGQRHYFLDNAEDDDDASTDGEEATELADLPHHASRSLPPSVSAGDDTAPDAVQLDLTTEPRVPLADHVLVDMNCIVHSCFGKHDVTTKTKKELIQLVMERVQLLLTQVVIPRKSLTICLDGPAPYAKLQTQRLRRRKVALMDSSAQQLTSLAITAGSLFLVELENALAAQFKLNGGKGFLRRRCPVYLYGSTVMGEGESKIARALAFLASNTAPDAGASEGDASAQSNRGWRDRRPTSHSYRDSALSVKGSRVGGGGGGGSSGDGFSNGAPFYNPDDTVTVLGNDIDLVMTCLGATPYHNISIVGPSALQLINVSDLLYRWLRATTTASGGSGGESFRVTPELLPSMRIDFIFLFLLNGGDHYVGAGEVAMPLWRRYRTVRAAYPHSTLVSKQLDMLDTDFLVDVLDARTYSGDADPKPGLTLLQSALWSLYTTVTGICPDYAYLPEPSTPFLQNLRAAAAYLKKKGRQMKLHFNIDSKPLAPLEVYVALMPTEATLPPSVANALRQPVQHVRGERSGEAPLHSSQEIARMLSTSQDASVIAEAAREAVALAQPFLSASEKYLCGFTPPVQLNAIPPRQRLRRFEQHRMLATRGAIVYDEPIPMVRRLNVTLCGTGFERSTATVASNAGHTDEGSYAQEYFVPPISYVRWRYPASTTALNFRCPFDHAGVGESREAGGGFSPSFSSTTTEHTGMGTTADSTKNGNRHTNKRVLLSHALRLSTRSVAAQATRAAEAKLERALAEVAALSKHRSEGSLKSTKRLHAMQRRMERLKRELDLCRRREADEDASVFKIMDATARHGGEPSSGEAAAAGRKRRRDEPQRSARSDESDDGVSAQNGGMTEEDTAFLADLEKFLGEAGGEEDVAQLLGGKEPASRARRRSGSGRSAKRSNGARLSEPPTHNGSRSIAKRARKEATSQKGQGRKAASAPAPTQGSTPKEKLKRPKGPPSARTAKKR